MSNQTAEIIPLPGSLPELKCTKCGATTIAVCNCGVRYIQASERAAEAVAANPEKSDRMIAEAIGVSDKTVAKARKSTAEKSAVEKRVGKDGKKRAPAGARTAVPSGYTSLGEAIAAGIEYERNHHLPPIQAAIKIGLAAQTYARMRDVVLLNQRTDLSLDDAKTVASAFRDLETNRQAMRPFKATKAIALKIWGQKGNRFKSEAKRLDAFLSSISMVRTVCASASEINIPHVSEDCRQNARADLSEAIAALENLVRRIRKGE